MKKLILILLLLSVFSFSVFADLFVDVQKGEFDGKYLPKEDHGKYLILNQYEGNLDLVKKGYYENQDLQKYSVVYQRGYSSPQTSVMAIKAMNSNLAKKLFYQEFVLDRGYVAVAIKDFLVSPDSKRLFQSKEDQIFYTRKDTKLNYDGTDNTFAWISKEDIVYVVNPENNKLNLDSAEVYLHLFLGLHPSVGLITYTEETKVIDKSENNNTDIEDTNNEKDDQNEENNEKINGCISACVSSKRCVFTQEINPDFKMPPECEQDHIENDCEDKCEDNVESYKPYVPKITSPTKTEVQKTVVPQGSTSAVQVPKIEKVSETTTRAEPVPAQPVKSEPGIPAPQKEVEDQTTKLLGIVIKLEETKIGLDQSAKRLDAIGIYYTQNNQEEKANAFFQAAKEINELGQQLSGLKLSVKENVDSPEKVYPLVKERIQNFKFAMKETVKRLLEAI
ncbi:hypothetical protein HZA97_06115 [Candidatus Woesearchaeota archaeon]|nr:hypothetical protein [Candidatus Woesearchaeota archaeon]